MAEILAFRLFPIYLILVPFFGLVLGTFWLNNWLIKINNAYRPLTIVIFLVSGGATIIAGWILLDYTIITPFILMGTGCLIILIGCYRSIFMSKQALIGEVQGNKTQNYLKRLSQVLLGERPPDDWVDTKGDVPHWVNVEVERILKRHSGTSSSLLGKYWTVKGRHYIYKISFGGQGGYFCYIFKKKR